MKRILFSVLFLYRFVSNAQTGDYHMHFNHDHFKNINKCPAEIVFNQRDQRDCSISMDVYKNVMHNNEIRAYMFFSGLSSGFFDDDKSYVQLILKDGKK